MEGTESRAAGDGSGTAEAGLVARREAAQDETVRANRAWWDANADEYQAEHGEYLGDARFLWCPEGLYEDEVKLLGDVAGLDVLEIGCGAAQCARYLADRGARVAALDLSARQLQHARRIDEQEGRAPLRLVQADATRLPFAAESSTSCARPSGRSRSWRTPPC